MSQSKLVLVTGCMFSSKTSYLLKEINRFKSIGYNVLVVNTIKDNRYSSGNEIVNHDKLTHNAISLINLSDIFSLSDYKIASVIIVEEANFFHDLIPSIIQIIEKDNKNVIACGLNGNYLRKPFGSFGELFCLADEIIFLKAYCKICNDTTEAIFTKRIVNNDNQELVGSTDKYIPVCRKHYLN
jgi:thymidine kinase